MLYCGEGVDWQVPVWDVGQSKREVLVAWWAQLWVCHTEVKVVVAAKTEKVFGDVITYVSSKEEERKSSYSSGSNV